jgi:hypothetical protein
MSEISKLKERWASRRFLRAMRRGEAAMAPYMDKMETVDGKRAMLMVAGIAQFVAMGIESPAFLKTSIQEASEISGIPPEALDAFAQAIMAMYEGAQASMESASPRDGGADD